MQSTKTGLSLRKTRIILPVCILFIALMLNACTLSTPKRVEGTAPAETGITADSTGLFLRPDIIENIQVIFTDDETMERSMLREDYARLTGLLQSAEYDRKWNDSGIMVKMVEPDYLLILSYQNKDQEQPLEYLHIWKESGRIKFGNVWFLLPVNQQPHLYELIEKYRQEDL